MKQHLCKTFHTIVVHMTSTPNALKKKFNVDVLDDVDGLTFESNGQVVIWTRDSSKHVLVHECVHAAYAICRRCGVKHDEETIAYLTEEMWSALC